MSIRLATVLLAGVFATALPAAAQPPADLETVVEGVTALGAPIAPLTSIGRLVPDYSVADLTHAVAAEEKYARCTARAGQPANYENRNLARQAARATEAADRAHSDFAAGRINYKAMQKVELKRQAAIIAYLPLVKASNTPAEQAFPQMTLVELMGHFFVEDGKTAVRIEGRLRNDGKRPMSQPDFSITYLDQNGFVLDSGEWHSRPPITIYPGQNWHFTFNMGGRRAPKDDRGVPTAAANFIFAYAPLEKVQGRGLSLARDAFTCGEDPRRSRLPLAERRLQDIVEMDKRATGEPPRRFSDDPRQ